MTLMNKHQIQYISSVLITEYCPCRERAWAFYLHSNNILNTYAHARQKPMMHGTLKRLCNSHKASYEHRNTFWSNICILKHASKFAHGYDQCYGVSYCHPKLVSWSTEYSLWKNHFLSQISDVYRHSV